MRARQTPRVGKDDSTEFLPIHSLIRGEDAASKFAHHILVSVGPGLDQTVGDLVGIQHAAAKFAKNRGDRGLSGGDSARQAHAQHQGLAATAPGAFIGAACARLRRAAFTVLLISKAMVSGPTPPGTGVIAPATSATPG